MKRFIAMTLVAAALLPAAAFADTTVLTPKNLTSKEEVAAYVGQLDAAVKRECYRATGPVIGVAVYAYQACIKDTRAAVAKKEPTGLYAKADSLGGVAIAAK
jgi:uncharacterized GH25 family protein